MKNAIDWISRANPSVLRSKPVTITGATVGGWGTLYAQAELRHTLAACGAFVMPSPQAFIRTAGDLFDEEDRLIGVENLKSLDALLAGFSSWLETANHDC